jgi:hypothetical protein
MRSMHMVFVDYLRTGLTMQNVQYSGKHRGGKESQV